MKGLFISFEGVEGSGKSLQTKRLFEYLDAKNRNCLLIREPGATSIGEKIRSIIIDVGNAEMNYYTEAYLYAAARAQLVNEVIKPAVLQGKIVICDRFVDSSYAYQGIARNLGLQTVVDINSYAVQDTMPDLTFFIKLDPDIGLQRKAADGVFDRLEQETIEFHTKVYNGYVELAKRYQQRIVTIDGTKLADDIAQEIVLQLDKRFPNLF